MEFLNKIGGVQFFNNSTVSEAVRKETKNNITELISRGVINKKEAEKLTKAFDSGEINFGDNGLTDDEIMNMDKSTFKALMKQYKAEKKSNKQNENLINKFLNKGYDKEQDIIAFQKAMKHDKHYINTTAGKEHFGRIHNNDSNQKIADISTEFEKPTIDIKPEALAEVDFSMIHTETSVIKERNEKPTIQQKSTAENVNPANTGSNAAVSGKKKATTTGTHVTREVRTADNEPASHSDDPVNVSKRPARPVFYSTPENVREIKFADLKKDESGKYVVPKGNYALDAADLPIEHIEFHLSQDSTLVINGEIKTARDYKEPEKYFVNMRFSDPKNKVYKDGDFEYSPEGMKYKGKVIDENEWEIKYTPIKHAGYLAKEGKNDETGVNIEIVRKSTITDPEKAVERKINVTGSGNFYAENIECPIDVNCNEFHVGTLNNSLASFLGNGSIDEVTNGTKLYAESPQKDLKIAYIEKAQVDGKGLVVTRMDEGVFCAEGTIENLHNGTVRNYLAKIVNMNGGTILDAQTIIKMEGGNVNLKRDYGLDWSPKKLVIKDYVDGKVISKNDSTVIIENGVILPNSKLIAQSTDNLKIGQPTQNPIGHVNQTSNNTEFTLATILNIRLKF